MRSGQLNVAFLGGSFLLDSTTGVDGTQVQLYNLAHGFKQRGIDVHYIASTRNWQREDETISGIKLHWIKRRRGVFYWILDLYIYFSLLNQIQPDVVYQRGRSYLTFVAAKWAKNNQKKFVWGSNGEDGCDFWKNMKILWKSKKALWKRMLLSPNAIIQDILIHRGIRGADRIVNQTESQRKKLFRNFRKKGIVVPSYFPLSASEVESPKKEKIVLWLANLTPDKRPEIFLKLAESIKDCAEWKLFLAGSTENRAYLKKISEEASILPNLKFLGYVHFKESNQFFAKASLFVNTSKIDAEGLPNTFIQAWLSKTPVLSLVHDPNGWIKRYNLGFCAEGNLDAFFEKGQQLLRNESSLAEIGGACRIFAVDTFATEKIIDAYIKLFKD